MGAEGSRNAGRSTPCVRRLAHLASSPPGCVNSARYTCTLASAVAAVGATSKKKRSVSLEVTVHDSDCAMYHVFRRRLNLIITCSFFPGTNVQIKQNQEGDCNHLSRVLRECDRMRKSCITFPTGIGTRCRTSKAEQRLHRRFRRHATPLLGKRSGCKANCISHNS